MVDGAPAAVFALQPAGCVIEDESLVVGPLYAEDKSPSLVALEALINARLPLVELPDLMEIDGWTGFSRHLEHAARLNLGLQSCWSTAHASILAQACNTADDTPKVPSVLRSRIVGMPL